MIKKLVFFFLFTGALGSITFLSIGVHSTAEECEDPTEIPTDPGEVDYCAMSQSNPESEPIIQASSEEIGVDDPITLHVKTSSLSHPPYIWSVSSEKYSLDKSTTMSNLETVTMTAASGSCSSSGYSDSNIYVTVTVTDNCGTTSQAIIRNTAGQWVYNTKITSSPSDDCDCSACYNRSLISQNEYGYVVCLDRGGGGADANEYTTYSTPAFASSNDVFPNNNQGHWCYENQDICSASVSMNKCSEATYPNIWAEWKREACNLAGGTYSTRLIRVYKWECP